MPHAIQQLSLWTTTIEPVLQSPGAAATEACVEPVLHNKRSNCNEKAAHHNWRVAPLSATREKTVQQWSPSAVKNKYMNYFQKEHERYTHINLANTTLKKKSE